MIPDIGEVPSLEMVLDSVVKQMMQFGGALGMRLAVVVKMLFDSQVEDAALGAELRAIVSEAFPEMAQAVMQLFMARISNTIIGGQDETPSDEEEEPNDA